MIFDGKKKGLENEMNKNESVLRHWGILGMKWGVRNGPPYPLTSSQMSSSERKHKHDFSLKDKTDEELKKDVGRMRLEKEYRDLSKSSITNGSKFVDAMLLAGGTLAITTFTTLVSSGVAAGVAKKIVKASVGG